MDRAEGTLVCISVAPTCPRVQRECIGKPQPIIRMSITLYGVIKEITYLNVRELVGVSGIVVRIKDPGFREK